MPPYSDLHGPEAPAVLSFEALDLTTDLNYAFKVMAPVNSIGDGILSAASIVTSARSGAIVHQKQLHLAVPCLEGNCGVNS